MRGFFATPPFGLSAADAAVVIAEAEYIEAHNRHAALFDAADRMQDGGGVNDPVVEEARLRMEAAGERLAALPVSGLPGLAVKAHYLALNTLDGHTVWAETLARQTLNDLPALTATGRMIEIRTGNCFPSIDDDAPAFLNAPDFLFAAELAERLGCSVEDVEASARDGKLLSVGGGNIPVRYPACQVVGDAVLPGLDRVLAAANGRRWEIYELLSRPQPEFYGATGMEMLQRGDIEPVIAHLSGYGDGFA
jgi:hypothetical protein